MSTSSSYVTCKDEISPKYGKKINEFHEPKAEIEAKGKKAPEGFEDLVFVTTRNAPVSQNDTDLNH